MRVAAFQHYGRICTSQIFGPPHVALEPLGAWHWCQRVAPCSQRAAQAVARVPEHHNVEGCSFQLPQLCLYTVYTKDFQTSIPEENRKKKYVACSVYSANSDKRFGVIRFTLFPQFLVCDLYRDLNLYSQGHPHQGFFNQEDAFCYYFFFFLSAGARILCSARHNSCSVLLDQSIKIDDFPTTLISSRLNMMFLSYLSWLLMPSF